MGKRIFVFAAILRFGIDVVAQPYLNNVYVFGGTGHRPTSILLENDGYIIASTGYTENVGTVSFRPGIILHKINFNGDTLWRKVYNQPGKTCSVGNYGSLAKINESYYLCGTCRDTITDEYDYYLTKFDSNGNKVFWTSYPKPSLQNCWHGTNTSDGGYLMIGETFFSGQDRDYYLLKTDSNGNKKWDDIYGGAENDRGFQVHQLNNNEYIISGVSASFGPGAAGSWILKLDSTGNEIWSNSYGTSGEDAFGIAIPSVTGYLIWGGGDTLVYNTETQYNEMIFKIDTAGVIQWRTFFNHQKNRITWQVREIANGNIIAIGEQLIGKYDSTAAWIAKLNSNGDVLWERFYFYDNGNDPLFDFEASFRGDFQQTPDSGFVIAGNIWKANASSPNLFFEQFWLVKLDSNGCFGPNSCGLTVSMNEIQPDKTPATIVAYPNPFTTQALISIKANSAEFASEKIQFQLFDVSGRLLQSSGHTLNQYGYCEFYVAREQIPSGIYFYQITSQKNILGKGKLIAR